MTTANKVNIKPLGDRVLVKPVESSQEEVKGGIIIPDSAKEKPTTAEVLALGNGKKDGEDYAFSVKVGDQVIISKYGGTSVKYDDVEYTILREDDILAIVG
ncbi:MAG: co-chaperone GroES [Opitutales bacterium]|jgi:chaperonin GroES|nr:co-chaperone GroES [Opitutales bacterium]